VTFKSDAFNTSVQKDYFINAGCYGDDLANWIISELQKRGIGTDHRPGQEDFGWYLDFKVSHNTFCLVVGYRPGDERESGTWIGWLERSRGLVGSILGGRERGITADAVEGIHEVLTSNPQIRQLRWHSRSDFDAGHEEHGALTPEGLDRITVSAPRPE